MEETSNPSSASQADDNVVKKIGPGIIATVALSSPLEHGDEIITELIIRKPKPIEIEELNNPVKLMISHDEKMGCPDYNYKLLGKYLSKLTALPPSVIREMDADDYFKACNEIGLFFMSRGSIST